MINLICFLAVFFFFLTTPKVSLASDEIYFNSIEALTVCNSISKSISEKNDYFQIDLRNGLVDAEKKETSLSLSYDGNKFVFKAGSFESLKDCRSAILNATPTSNETQDFYEIFAIYNFKPTKELNEKPRLRKHYNSSCRTTRTRRDIVCFANRIKSYDLKVKHSRCGATLSTSKIIQPEKKCVGIDVILRSCGRGTFGDCKGHGAINFEILATTELSGEPEVRSRILGKYGTKEIEKTIFPIRFTEKDVIVDVTKNGNTLFSLYDIGQAKCFNGQYFKLTENERESVLEVNGVCP